MIKTKIKTKSRKFNFKMVNKILLLLIVASGVYYLTCINDLSVNSFRIQELKKEISCLDNENINFEAMVMSLNSYNNLSQRVEKLNMTAVGEVKHIAGAGSVAMQK